MPLVAKGDVLELDVAAQAQAAGEGGDLAGLPFHGRLCRALFLFFLGRVENVVQALQIRLQHLKQVRQLDEGAHRLQEAHRGHVERGEATHRHAPRHHLPATQAQHRGGGEDLERRRQRRVHIAEFGEPLPGGEFPGLMPRPTGKEVILAGGGLQHVNLGEARHADAHEHALLTPQPTVFVHPHPRQHAHQHSAENGQNDDHPRQQRVVRQHEAEKGEARQQLDEDADQVARHHLGDRIQQVQTGRQIPREALREEPHGQLQQPRHEALGVVDGEADREPPETAFAQPSEPVKQGRRTHQGRDDGTAPGRLAPGEHEIDEQAHQEGHRQSRHRQQQTAPDRERQRLFDVAQPRHDPVQEAGAHTARLEVRPRLEGEGDAGERLVELLRADAAMAIAGVVDEEPSAPEAFQHHEVVELPEQDHRQRQGAQLMRVSPPPLRLQAIATGGPKHVRGVAAIPTHRAPFPQLLDGHPAPEMGQHDAEAGGAALSLRELQEHRGADATIPALLARLQVARCHER